MEGNIHLFNGKWGPSNKTTGIRVFRGGTQEWSFDFSLCPIWHLILMGNA